MGRRAIPTSSIVLGYGPMLPLVAAAIGAWTLAGEWPLLAVRLAVIWGALILAFIGGVRRGYGFGAPAASTRTEIVTSIGYFTVAGLALVAPTASIALALLAIAYAGVGLLDGRAARRGDAPAHFARLRPPQLLLGAAALAVLWAYVTSSLR